LQGNWTAIEAVGIQAADGADCIRDGTVNRETSMRVLGIAALVIALATVSAPIRAQQPEPHSQGFRAKLKARYLERRNRFMHRVKDVYFAVGCNVLAREAGIMPLTSSESYLAYVGDQTIIDTRDEGGDAGRARSCRKTRRVRLLPETSGSGRKAASGGSGRGKAIAVPSTRAC
jgi:hypothetical protein